MEIKRLWGMLMGRFKGVLLARQSKKLYKSFYLAQSPQNAERKDVFKYTENSSPL